MNTAGATVVLAHGLGGSSDLPVPYAYAMVGAAWALTFTFALVAFAWRRPRFDPLKPGRPLPTAVTTLVDARATRWTAAAVALVFTVWVVLAAVWGPQTQFQRPARRVLRAVVGRVGGALVAVRARLAGDLADAHGVSAAPAVHARTGWPCAPVLSRKLGLSPRRGGPVRLRVDGTGQPGLGVAAVGQGVAADLWRGDAGRGVAVRAALVGPRRPVRRVQHGGVATLPVSPQSDHRENRHR